MPRPRPELLQLVHSATATPMVLLLPGLDVQAWNPLGHALLAGHLDRAAPERASTRPNLARLVFFDRCTRTLLRDRDDEARLVVASLRVASAERPEDHRVTQVVDELTSRSPESAGLWRRHPVRRCAHGHKRYDHPLVGALDLDFEVLHLLDDAGHRLLVHTAPAGSSSAAGLVLLQNSMS